ncbi:hypothetical protein HAX54_011843 [Datura stramonium]|uniref:Uncharacterized protein n=1 Tax=Datura stramonium TaxID=4076 RepID=A0ABS8RZ44_DATST|nr:hypothetical protein [Datura stramonium]
MRMKNDETQTVYAKMRTTDPSHFKTKVRFSSRPNAIRMRIMDGNTRKMDQTQVIGYKSYKGQNVQPGTMLSAADVRPIKCETQGKKHSRRCDSGNFVNT